MLSASQWGLVAEWTCFDLRCSTTVSWLAADLSHHLAVDLAANDLVAIDLAAGFDLVPVGLDFAPPAGVVVAVVLLRPFDPSQIDNLAKVEHQETKYDSGWET